MRIPTITLKAPPIIEITSPSSNDGKSQFLYYMITISILPKDIEGIQLGGQDAAVVVLDTETRFHVPRLVQVMRHHISSRISSVLDKGQKTIDTLVTATTPGSDYIETTIAEALKHVHIFHPQSLPSLIATVHSLPGYLFDPHAHSSSHKRVASIILDSASSFYWQDKAEMEMASLPPDSDARDAAGSRSQSHYVALASAIRKASAALKAPVVYTTWNLSSGPNHGAQTDGDGFSLRSHLPAPWPSLATLRLVVSRRAVRKFPVGMTGEEAARQKQSREAAVRRGVFDVSVNKWGSGDWTDRVVEGLRRRGDGGFEVRVGAEGVVVES